MFGGAVYSQGFTMFAAMLSYSIPQISCNRLGAEQSNDRGRRGCNKYVPGWEGAVL